MKWTEAQIIRALSYQTLDRQCLLFVDRPGWTGHECDILAVTKDCRIIDIEVKISRADFRADAKKDKWWQYKFLAGGYERQPREWPQKVWKHYYAVPADIWCDDLVAAMPSQSSGVIILTELRGGIKADVLRKAKPCRDSYVLTDTDVIAVARLANLRMWEAYHRCKPVEVSHRPRVKIGQEALL